MKNSAAQFMDKQIMDLSNPRSVADGREDGNFIDLLNRPLENKKEDILPSYDFMPIRQALGSTSPVGAVSSDFDTGEVDGNRRKWNSFDSKTDAPSIRSYNVLDADESAKFSLQKNKNNDAHLNVSLVSEIDKILRKNMENLAHSIDTIGARLSQLETRTRNIEISIDELKGSVHNNHGSTDGRLRLLENILNEVRSDAGFIKDKQEILETQLRIAKLRDGVPSVEKDESSKSIVTDHVPNVSGFSPVQPSQPAPQVPTPNPHQNLQIPTQLPARESYFPPSIQTPDKASLPYQVSAPQTQPQPQPQPQLQPVPFPQQQQQYQSPPQPQYGQQPPPSAMPPQAPQSFSGANPSVLLPPFVQHPEEVPSYIPPQTYPPGMQSQSSQPPPGLSTLPPVQSYGPSPPNSYFPPPVRTGPGVSGPFGPPGTGEAYPNPYNNPQSQYGSSSHIKPQQQPSAYTQLPTARILPDAIPTATPVGATSSGSGDKVPTDDVVDRVAAMGFPRDQVRATVRRLNDEGHAIDLNIVLDKLMNGGVGQAPRGWFGR